MHVNADSQMFPKLHSDIQGNAMIKETNIKRKKDLSTKVKSNSLISNWTLLQLSWTSRSSAFRLGADHLAYRITESRRIRNIENDKMWIYQIF